MKNTRFWLFIDIILAIIFLFGTTKVGSNIVGQNLGFLGPTTFYGALDYFNIVFYGGLLFVIVGLFVGLISLKLNLKIGLTHHINFINYLLNALKKILYVCFGLGGLLLILSFGLELTEIQLASFFLFSMSFGSIIDNHLIFNETNKKMNALKTIGIIILIGLIMFFLIFLQLI